MITRKAMAMIRFVKREVFWEVLQTNKMLLLLTLETLQTFLDSMTNLKNK